jgi:hypothetical protein
MLFRYHSGEQALVFPHTVTGKPVGVKLSTLVAIGWKVTDAGLRLLPRFDAPQIQIESASRLQAIDFAKRLVDK